MKIIRVTYFALATLFSVVSCSKEATEPDVYDWADGEIYFKTSLSAVATSRAQDMTLDRLESFQVTCFNTADRYTDEAGYISPYFENATFIRKPNGTYASSPAEEPCNWPTNNGVMRFIAFSPSITEMESDFSAPTDEEGADNSQPEDEEENDESLPEDSEDTESSTMEPSEQEGFFKLINSTTETDTDVSVGYRLGSVRINPDISRQFDFVTAEATGKRLDFLGGVELSFSHKLCLVELNAWGENMDGYYFDIAGVRIGNPVVEGTFVFADDSAPQNNGTWEIPDNSVKGKVEYLYRCAENSETENIPEEGDRIFRINSTEHNTQESAASIMGNGGYAMVMPTKNKKWEGLEDPNIENTPYTTDKMYFSILMRVTDSASGKVVYPYPGNKSGLTLVSYAVDSSGNILKRLYSGDKGGTYFTDSGMENQYETAEGEEIMDFGWAAVPVDADWSVGKKYIYTLNYSEGIGMHDPEDPEPGKIIRAISNPVLVDVEVTDWNEGESTDVTVPRK